MNTPYNFGMRDTAGRDMRDVQRVKSGRVFNISSRIKKEKKEYFGILL